MEEMKRHRMNYIMGHGKPGKSRNLQISFSRPGKAGNLIFGHGKSHPRRPRVR